jgi:hypothetical protein
MPGRAVCPTLGPGGRWIPWHANRAPGASARANEVGPTGSTADHGSAQEPGWLVGRLRLAVGHASTVRPDPSTLGAAGERGSHRESCLQLGSGSAFRSGSAGRWFPSGDQAVLWAAGRWYRRQAGGNWATSGSRPSRISLTSCSNARARGYFSALTSHEDCSRSVPGSAG